MKKVLSILIVLILALPVGAEAVSLPTSLKFGGYVTGATFCTCPPFGLNITYKKLFLNSSFPIVGTLFYPAVGALLFAYYLPGVPTTWELGGFVPGGTCNMLNPANAAVGNPDPCAPPIIIPTMGTIRYMGTSRPGASIF